MPFLRRASLLEFEYHLLRLLLDEYGLVTVLLALLTVAQESAPPEQVALLLKAYDQIRLLAAREPDPRD